MRMNSVIKCFRLALLLFFGAVYSPEAYAQCQIKLKSGSLEGCAPHPIAFSVVNNTGLSITGWDWTFGDGNGSNDTAPPYLYQNPGSYTVGLTLTLSDGTKCFANLDIKVFDKPKPKIILPTPTTQCFKGNNFKFTHSSQRSADGFPIVKYIWNFGDGDTTGVENPNHTYDSNGVYTISLRVTDSKGCTDIEIQQLSIKVLPDIKPRFIANGLPGCDSTVYSFNNQTDTNGIWLDAFTWNFDDGTTVSGNVSDPDFLAKWSGFKHTYKDEGPFFPSLTITNKLGCKATFTPAKGLENYLFELKVQYKDTICWAGNSVRFEAQPIPGVIYWVWNFGDPPSGPENTAEYSWIASHKFVSGPKNYSVTFTAIHPVCGTIDTCITVHIVGPQAFVNPPPPSGIPPHNYKPVRLMPRGDFIMINSSNKCEADRITYSYFVKGASVTKTVDEYCNAPYVSDMDTVNDCDGTVHIYEGSRVYTPTGSKSVTYIDSTEIQALWLKGNPYPWTTSGGRREPYFPSSGSTTYQRMHDSDMYVCPYDGNLVRFTNNSKKYRLYPALDNTPWLYFFNPDLLLPDTCLYPNTSNDFSKGDYQYSQMASDSMLYFWDFNDGTAKPCTSSVSNPDWDCAFSTIAAPYH
ncbi:MAG: PKD domain-containing protein, partial [Bacteroidota bacterium]|nr:PKD domain-containing protein [Bacteroidota bacterium]